MTEILSNQEIRRYNRQMMLSEIGWEGQEKLKKSKVLVIGAGGLGTPVLLYLAASGVGEIGIVDNDLVDESNLQRQILYGSMDLGKQKAIIAKQRLEALNHLNQYNIHVILVNDENAAMICSHYDILVDATDNFPARYALDSISKKLEKPLVSGSLHTFEAMVTVYNYKGGPGLTELFPEIPNEENAAQAKDLGIPGILPGIAGTIMGSEVLKMITGTGEVLSGRLLIYHMLNATIEHILYGK